ncbi:MAG: hypothetical protein WED05_09710 [Candidatus Atabeyarchaeum deiterrae]
MSDSERDWKEPIGVRLFDLPQSCASCDLAEKFELKAGSVVALCKKNDCMRFSKPVSYKYIAELKPSDKITDELLRFAGEKVAERIARERQRQMKRIKQDEGMQIQVFTKTTQVTNSTEENTRNPQDEVKGQFDKLDEELKQVGDSFESKFEMVRKRLVKAKELRTKELAEPRSGEQASAGGWNQLIEKYRNMLKVAEPELNGILKRASGIDEILETKTKQVDSELPLKECELKVEEDLKEDKLSIEQLQKSVGSLRQLQEECLPRKERLRNLLERVEYCTAETGGAGEESLPGSTREDPKEHS